MAFFKFRQRGQSQDEPQGRAGKSAAVSPQETVDSLRRRARQRLLGALVLVLLAVVGFPLLFDTQPRPVAVDAAITIPDKDSVAPLRQPASAASASVPPASSSVSADASLGAGEEVVAAVPESADSAASAAPPALPAASSVDQPASQSQPDVTPAQRQQTASAPSRPDSDERARREAEAKARREAEAKARAQRQQAEAERARALLEGRTPPPAPRAAPPAGADRGASRNTDKGADKSADKGRFIIQIGAFADAGKVRQVRQQAERAGLKTYTQDVNTKDGKRTRVRAGPYASRAEAERAAAALQKAGLTGSILSL